MASEKRKTGSIVNIIDRAKPLFVQKCLSRSCAKRPADSLSNRWRGVFVFRKNKLMDKIMEKLNKLSLPITILIASVILGSFYYASQVSKQKSIEKQQLIKIKQKQQVEYEADRQAEKNTNFLDKCLENAEIKAKELNQAVMDNAVGKQYDSIVKTLDDIKWQLEKSKDECFKRHQQ